MSLIKPVKLNIGDTIATISPSWGIAGEPDAIWKYQVGKKRLEEMGLCVVPAPNSMRGEAYLAQNPAARAEDILWAFENKSVNAILANIGGQDCSNVFPYLDANTINRNPKILMGYSDVTWLHLFCCRAGLSTFYGPNLFSSIAEMPQIHPYSKHWFKKVLFDPSPIGIITPANTYSCDKNNYFDPYSRKSYHAEHGYNFIQGSDIVQGRLFGGITALKEFPGISPSDFADVILFVEDIPSYFSPKHLASFIDWLGRIGALQILKGLLIGKPNEYISFDAHESVLLEVVRNKYGCTHLPIVTNMNFGHSSPTCIFPYGAMAEINCQTRTVTIFDPGVTCEL